ncbi:MAG: tetratricopeptide repeat protein, partial [Prevotellaceae bacterium]|nr:tetratricopeptide repeat protein [Prevotellaceae bacterium]
MKISQVIKTALGIASLFIFGLAFRELLKLTMNKDLAGESSLLFVKGFEASEKGNYKDAVDILSKSLKFDSTNVDARNCLGKTLLRMEKYSEAVERLTAKIVNDETLKIRGDAYFALENYSAAFVDYSESLKISPNASAYAGLGNVFVKMNNLPEGVNSYTKAIELDADCADYYFLRGKALNLQGKHDEAIND